MSFPAPSFLPFGPALPAGLTRRMASRGSWPGRAAIRVQTRRCMIWGLIAALCIYAMSGSLLRIVGPQHWHAMAAQAAPAAASEAGDSALAPLRRWLSGIRSLSDDLHARAHAMGMTAHPHNHSALLRHWHGQDDNTVRVVADEAIDPALADLKAAAAIGGATLLLALAPACAWRLPGLANGRWPVASATRWRSAESIPPAEPPMA